MKHYTNKKTGQISKFACTQGKDWTETTKEEIRSFELKQEKPKLINERIAYLNSTDWYVIRDLEGKKISKEIKDKRKRARDEINKIELIDNKKDIESYKSF